MKSRDTILKTLFENRGKYVSGEELGRLAGMTRAGIHKVINAMREDGCIIESTTKKGYKLIGSKNSLCASAVDMIVPHLNTTIANRLYYFDTVSSTFDKISEYPPSEGLTVLASHQTSGRGRLGRNWNSGDGGIYFTFMIYPKYEAANAPFITLICALAVWRVLNGYVPCSIKWPNDIVSADGRKLCGILTKTTLCQEEIESVSVGIGINANNSFDSELPNAASIGEMLGKPVDENKLFAKIIQELDRTYYNEDRGDILNEYKCHCANLNENVTIHYTDGRGDVEGVCMDILSDGSMRVRCESGEVNVRSGEVSVRGIYQSERKQP